MRSRASQSRPHPKLRNQFSDSMARLSNARVSLYELARDVADNLTPPSNQTGTEWVSGVLRLADRAGRLCVPTECLFPVGGPHPKHETFVQRLGADHKYAMLSTDAATQRTMGGGMMSWHGPRGGLRKH